MRILLIEDDLKIGRSLTAGLGDDGVRSTGCDGPSAVAALSDSQAAHALALQAPRADSRDLKYPQRRGSGYRASTAMSVSGPAISRWAA